MVCFCGACIGPDALFCSLNPNLVPPSAVEGRHPLLPPTLPSLHNIEGRHAAAPPASDMMLGPIARPKQFQQLLNLLEKIAPKELAAGWDNVGLLLDCADDSKWEGSFAAGQGKPRVFLTNDLTESVANEVSEIFFRRSWAFIYEGPMRRFLSTSTISHYHLTSLDLTLPFP